MATNHGARVHGLADGKAWDEFCAQLGRAGRLVIDAAPDDEFERAEGLRYVGRIARYALDSFIERSDPAAPSVTTGLPKLGGDNPDYLYASAPLSGRFDYRLRGNVGDARYLGLGTYTGDVGTVEGLKLSGYLAGAELHTDASGNFEVTVSSEKKPGNWLAMKAETTQLMIRQTLLDRGNGREATFEIERIDGGVGAAPLDPTRYAEQLALAGNYVVGAIAQFLDWTKNFASRPNEIRVLDPKLAAGAQGDPFTHYYGGYYEIAEDEVLIVDLKPPKCDYWNVQLCNHWLESLDYTNYTVHVNDHTAVATDGGAVRVVVAHRDPGVPNWLDTAGHRRGCMILRWVGTDAPYDPKCRVAKHEEVS